MTFFMDSFHIRFFEIPSNSLRSMSFRKQFEVSIDGTQMNSTVSPFLQLKSEQQIPFMRLQAFHLVVSFLKEFHSRIQRIHLAGNVFLERIHSVLQIRCKRFQKTFVIF